MGQNLGKYHITEEGKIYRINDDSSYTYLGNAEDKAGHQPTKNGINGHSRSRKMPTKEGDVKKKSNSVGWIIFGILFYIGAIVSVFIALLSY